MKTRKQDPIQPDKSGGSRNVWHAEGRIRQAEDRIRALHAAGMTIRRIVDTLTAEGVTCSRSNVSRLLKSPVSGPAYDEATMLGHARRLNAWCGAAEIAQALNAAQLLNPKGRPWSTSGVRRMLAAAGIARQPSEPRSYPRDYVPVERLSTPADGSDVPI